MGWISGQSNGWASGIGDKEMSECQMGDKFRDGFTDIESKEGQRKR